LSQAVMGQVYVEYEGAASTNRAVFGRSFVCFRGYVLAFANVEATGANRCGHSAVVLAQQVDTDSDQGERRWIPEGIRRE